MAAQRDRKAYQADYYRRNKKALNARRAAARRKIRGEANGAIPKAAAKLTGAAAAKAIADWSGRNLVVPTPPRQGHPFRLGQRPRGQSLPHGPRPYREPRRAGGDRRRDGGQRGRRA